MTTRPPTLQEFIEAARRYFDFLVTEFGFEEIPVSGGQDGNPFLVRYQSASTLVTVEGIQWGFGVQIGLSPVRRGIVSRHAMIPLWSILKLRCPDLEESCAKAGGQLSQLEAYAAALHAWATDLLRGDFTVTADAERVIAEEAAEAHAVEEQRRYEAGSVKASEAFHRKDYAEFIRIIEPFADRLTSGQRRSLEYAKRQIK